MDLTIVLILITVVLLTFLLLQRFSMRRSKGYIEVSDTLLRPEELERHAVEIASKHEIAGSGKGFESIIPRLKENHRYILDTYKRLNEDVRAAFPTVPAAEWLLDNYYVIEEQVKDITNSAANLYNYRLPILDRGYLRGYPRVYDIALELVSHTEGEIDDKILVKFLKAYQTHTLLSIGELWAIIFMIRIALIEKIRQVCEKINESRDQWYKAEEAVEYLTSQNLDDKEHMIQFFNDRLGSNINPSFVEHLLLKMRKQQVKSTNVVSYLDSRLAESNSSTSDITEFEHQVQASRQLSMRNAITSLRMVSVMDWTEFFEELSHVENVLRRDPADVYSRMEFESRDYYRQMVERIARLYGVSEGKVAQKAVECASEAVAESPLNHVGYYIAGEGRPVLEKKLGKRPRGGWVLPWMIRRHPFISYMGTIIFTTSVISILLACYAWSNADRFPLLMALIAGAVAAIPLSDPVVSIVNTIVGRICHPTMLPKLELREGIPDELCTMVIVPTLLPNAKRVKELLSQMEVAYLGNRDKNLFFAIVGDFKDSANQEEPGDGEIINAAVEGIKELNSKYGSQESDRFFYFHRYRQYYENQNKWMGWERKRGAIVEFNEFITGSDQTSFNVVSGNIEKLPRIKYIITLDADTCLPIGAAKRLIGALAHPMNRAVIDEKTGVVKKGYGLLQPRIGITAMAANSTLFSRIFAGQGGIDPYTTAVSDVYQDLFGEGIFTGKGIYDLEVFKTVLRDAIPDNAVLSHDLLEGSYVRAGLATDIELVDGYPSRYNSYAMRLHRWVRGDWQLLPWLCRRVRDRSGKLVPNPLNGLSRWKILDNLRRSLVSPLQMLFVLLAVTVLPGYSYVWLAVVLSSIFTPMLNYVFTTLITRNEVYSGLKYHSTVITGFRAALYQSLLLLLFLPHQAYLMTNAIVKTIYRVLVSKRNMLEWVTAADMELNLKNDLASSYRRMWACPAAGILVVALSYLYAPYALFMAAVLLLLWFVAPYMAYELSKPYSREIERLSEDGVRELRLLARKTWRYFEDFAGERDNYLPPDNFQEEPVRVVAHRTSPTNIGFLVMSIVAARDFGYIGSREMIDRIDRVITTIERMQKWNGHLYNWYDTITLNVLKPLYVSTVDSGNLIGYLMTVRQALFDYMSMPLIDSSLAKGLLDTIELFQGDPESEGVKIEHGLLDKAAGYSSLDACTWSQTLDEIIRQASDDRIRSALEKSAWGRKLIDAANGLRKELDDFLPAELYELLRAVPEEKAENTATEAEAPNDSDHVYALLQTLIAEPSLVRMSSIYGKAVKEAGLNQLSPAWEKVEEQLARGRKLVERIEALIREMEFKPLFDKKRQLFSIGYNVDEGHLSKSYYDLLASEARQASFIAVARGEISQRHWFRLGRKLVMVDRYKGLASWTGTMFEYLMPLLLMKNYENTLLDETYRFVVNNQIRYGYRNKIPWGVSESAFNALDISLNYQYKAFGIPELGLKRGLENDTVISPYSSVLALMIDPQAALANIRKLQAEGVGGDYGLYEAVDYTPSRLQKDSRRHIIRSFMAHHQGMSLAALDNCLNGNIMQKRFHADPVIKSAELLLQEKIPTGVTFNKDHRDIHTPNRKKREEEGEVVRTFGIPDPAKPDVHVLTNGSYSVMVTAGGSGYSKYYGMAVSRWVKDLRSRPNGTFIFVQNMNSNNIWSATYEPLNTEPEQYKAVFSPDKAEFIRRDGSIETRTEIAVSPEDNVEIRRVSLTNYSQNVREIELTSYFEVVLADPDSDIAHPAFSNLFIRTEFVREYGCLLASRRPRSENQRVQWAMHGMAVEGDVQGDIQYETDRLKFVGRNRDISYPMALDVNRPLSNSEGAVLDPIMSLRRRVRIEPGKTATVCFITAVADDRKLLLELADKYSDPRACTRAFELSWTRSQIETKYMGFKSSEVEAYLELLPMLIFPSRSRRIWADRIVANRKSQPDLWPFGISGDLPIVLASIGERDETDLVAWLLKAHEYWRIKGIECDLVFLIENENSYTQPLQDVIRDMLAASHARELVDKRGGVFIRNAGLMQPEERDLFYAASRIVLQGSKGSALEQLKEAVDDLPLSKVMERKPEPKSGGGSYPDRPDQRTAEGEGLIFYNGLGGFSSDGTEYIIRVKKSITTPAPWINVIANRQFGFVISESGGGYAWFRNSRENKLTPWSNDPVTDPVGEVIYIRDDISGNYWSMTPMPAGRGNAYMIRHGFGYSVFENERYGLTQQLTVFAAGEQPVKLSLASLENQGTEKRILSLFYYIRPVLGVNESVTSQHIKTAVEDSGTILIQNSFNSDFASDFAFVDCSIDERFHTTDRDEFLGRSNSLRNPEALSRQRLSGRHGAGYDPCVALQVKIELEPGERKIVVFVLGEAGSREEALSLAQTYRNPEKAMEEFDSVRRLWKERLDKVRVSTPDKSMDIMLNGWLLYQVISCRLWARSAFYQSGGAFGFRDQLQDVMAVTYTWPELTRRQIMLHCEHQFVEGDVQHWWHAEAGKGIRTRYSDDLVWLVYVTCDYIECTGDWSILDEQVGYLESPPLTEDEDERYEVPARSQLVTSVYEHCVRALEKALAYGEHGIPLMGSGDWNDGMNKVGNKGRGESIWLGWFLCTVLKRFIPVCRQRNDNERAERYAYEAERIAENIEKNAWDGSWYRRAYFDDGTPLGSSLNTECRLDSISQSWSVISGSGRASRTKEAMNSVDKHLVDTDEGIIKLLAPPFDKAEPDPGYIRGYVPGVRENGGQYTHAAVWTILAFALMGRGGKAWWLYHMINPINHTLTHIEYSRYKVEPYVMAADVYSVYPHNGRGGWSWYTGAAGWMYRTGLEHILGLKKRGEYLVIDPCIPNEWRSYDMTYTFGNTTYSIKVNNPSGVHRNVKSVTLDGAACEDLRVPLVDDGREHKVEVTLG